MAATNQTRSSKSQPFHPYNFYGENYKPFEIMIIHFLILFSIRSNKIYINY